MEFWGWYIAIYLFLGGTGAGAYLTSLAADKGLLGDAPQLKRIGYIISGPVAGFGALLLVMDLGQGIHKPWLLIGLLSNPYSVMTWGTGILSIFIFLGLARGLLAFLSRPSPKWLDYTGAVFAVATGIYTGMLIFAVRAIPFWNNYALPILFLISALSSGMSATSILAHFLEKEHSADHRGIIRVHVRLVAGELIVLFIVFALIFSGLMGPVAVHSGNLLLYDHFSAVFWILLVGVGLVGPFIVYIKNPANRYIFSRQHEDSLDHDLVETHDSQIIKLPGNFYIQKSKSFKTIDYFLLCDLAVLIGGLSLRCLFIFAALPVWDGRLI
ncbi:MAG: NrfD/PsrC family molybdoenzyme membrane anchor subunit [Desulfitobacteriaceae bacterium]